MDLGWLILSTFLFVEVTLVTLLCAPMPSNEIRGAVTSWVASLWDLKPVQYAVLALLALDVFYFAFVYQALSNPLYDLGIFSREMGVSCEYKRDLYLMERNAYVSVSVFFIFFVLRRLVDIQDKLHIARSQVKAMEGGGGGGSGKLLQDGAGKSGESDVKKLK